MKIVFRYVAMQDVVDFAIATLKERSPVGSGRDPHPGLYRDSHMVFLNGHNVKDVSGWKEGDTIHISNPVPYSRKIEAGRMQMSVPAHVYEQSEPIISGRFGNGVAIKFVFMPITFGSMEAWASNTTIQRAGRRLNPKSRRDWLVRQPALMITARG